MDSSFAVPVGRSWGTRGSPKRVTLFLKTHRSITGTCVFFDLFFGGHVVLSDVLVCGRGWPRSLGFYIYGVYEVLNVRLCDFCIRNVVICLTVFAVLNR